MIEVTIGFLRQNVVIFCQHDVDQVLIGVDFVDHNHGFHHAREFSSGCIYPYVQLDRNLGWELWFVYIFPQLKNSMSLPKIKNNIIIKLVMNLSIMRFLI